jgi:hypothetical protein
MYTFGSIYLLRYIILLLYVYDDDSYVICLTMQIEMWKFGMWIIVQNYVMNV